MSQQLSFFDGATKTSEEIRGDYFIAISIYWKIREYIMLLRKKIYSTISLTPEQLHSVPHISIFKVPFKGDRIDDRIIQFVDKKLKSTKKFTIKLNGLEVFEHGQKKSFIYKIENEQPINEIFHLLHDDNSKKKYFTPHLTLVKSLQSRDYDKILMNLSEFEYNAEFLCDRISILKRTMEGEKKSKYRILHEVILQP